MLAVSGKCDTSSVGNAMHRFNALAAVLWARDEKMVDSRNLRWRKSTKFLASKRFRWMSMYVCRINLPRGMYLMFVNIRFVVKFFFHNVLMLTKIIPVGFTKILVLLSKVKYLFFLRNI